MFYEEIRKIIPKISLLLILFLSTVVMSLFAAGSAMKAQGPVVQI